jgi:hypothetical protein
LKLSGRNLRDSRNEELYGSIRNCPDGACVIPGTKRVRKDLELYVRKA